MKHRIQKQFNLTEQRLITDRKLDDKVQKDMIHELINNISLEELKRLFRFYAEEDNNFNKTLTFEVSIIDENDLPL